MGLPACRGRSIGDNALRRAAAIAGHYRPLVISDSFPDSIPEGVETLLVHPPLFGFLRRFCHVPNELGFAWAVRKALAGLQARERIAFLLCHGYTLAWFTGRWFRRRTGVPFGMFMHGHIFERPKGTYDPRVTAFYGAIAPTCYREADRLFALSPAQAELAVAAGASWGRVVLAPNGLDLADVGIDPPAAERKVAGWRLHRPLRLLYVGRLSVEKGLDLLLGACARLSRDGIDFRLRIIGSGPEEERLRARCGNLGLAAGMVEFVGPVPRGGLGVHYLEHDLLLVPSRSEPLGNVVLEGMAGGCLVIGADTGGIPSMVTDGVTGFLFEPDDEPALHACLVRAIQDEGRLAEIVANAGEWCRRHATWQAIGERVAQAVDGLAVRERKGD